MELYLIFNLSGNPENPSVLSKNDRVRFMSFIFAVIISSMYSYCRSQAIAPLYEKSENWRDALAIHDRGTLSLPRYNYDLLFCYLLVYRCFCLVELRYGIGSEEAPQFIWRRGKVARLDRRKMTAAIELSAVDDIRACETTEVGIYCTNLRRQGATIERILAGGAGDLI